MQPSGVGLRQKSAERLYVVKADLLVVPAKLRRSPRPLPQTADSYRSDTHTSLPSLHPGPVYCRYSRLHRSELSKSESFWYVGLICIT
jgi:hypothetical protein